MKLFDVKVRNTIPDPKVKNLAHTVYSIASASVPFDEAKKVAKPFGKRAWIVEHRNEIEDLRKPRVVRVKKYSPYKHH
jgi:hypothetical protein